MPSWEDAASRYDKEQADKQQREADERARKEREHAANLKEVAKADRLVQDFLRAAKSVGNPGAKQDTYEEVGWFSTKRKPRGVKHWSSKPYPIKEADFSQRTPHFSGFAVMSMGFGGTNLQVTTQKAPIIGVAIWVEKLKVYTVNGPM